MINAVGREIPDEILRKDEETSFYRSVFPKKRCGNKNNCKKQMCCN